MKITYLVSKVHLAYTQVDDPIQFASEEEIYDFCKSHLDDNTVFNFGFDSLDAAMQKLKELKDKMTYSFDNGILDDKHWYYFETDFAWIAI